jgi:hypothetical protein
MTGKHIPGAVWTYVVYNKNDMLILSQDARQHSDGKWIFTKYDALGRVVMTGSWDNSGSRSDIQDAANSINETIFWEARDNSTYNYTNSAYPRPDYSNLLTINYYDDYAFGIEGKNFEVVSGYNSSASSMTKGIL